MSTFSKDHASSSCSSSTAANALLQLRGDEEEGGVRDMRNARVDIFSWLFVGLGLCLAFRIKAQQSHDIEQGAMQPSTEHNRTSDNGTDQMPLQNAVDGLLPRDEATTENRIFSFDLNPSTPWYCMLWALGAVMFLSLLLHLVL